MNDPMIQTAIEDARAHNAAVVGLIATQDAQAASLLSLYATLGIAAVSGAFAAYNVE